MRSRSWLFIVVIGIAGLMALGFMTKFALESNPSLMRVVKLKEAIAEDFSAQGVRTVAVQALPHQRGYEIRIEAARDRMRDPKVFTDAVAEFFLRRFGGPLPPSLKLCLLDPPSGLGWGEPVAYFEKEYRLLDLKNVLELRQAISRLEASVCERKGCRVVGSVIEEVPRIKVEIPEPQDDPERERTLEFLRRKCREHLAAGAGRVVVLEVWSGGPVPRLLKEERLERARSGRPTGLAAPKSSPQAKGPGAGSGGN